MIDRRLRLTVTGLLAVGLAVTAAVWPSRPSGTTVVAARPTGTAGVPGPARAAALDGAAVFRAKGCATCHNGPESEAAVPVGPDLGLVATVADRRVEGLDAEAYVRQSIRDPLAFRVAGYEQQMPTLPIDDEELDALVQYLLG